LSKFEQYLKVGEGWIELSTDGEQMMVELE